MSALEAAVLPTMGPLIHDLSFDLSPSDQHLIALWTIKTAMVFEALTAPGRWFFTDDDRDTFLTNIRPPLETFVWLGQCDSFVFGYTEARRLSGSYSTSRDRESPLSEGCVNTFGFGRLALHSVSFRRKPDAVNIKTTLDIRRGPWDRLLIPVWPIGGRRVTWPPPLSFSDSGITLDELGERYRAGPPPASL